MKHFRKWRQILVFCVLAALTLTAGARSKPHLPTNDEMFSWVEEVVNITERYPQFRRAGTEGDAKVRRYIVSKLREFGYDNVAEQSYEVTLRQYERWQLNIDGITLPTYFMRGAGFTEEAGVTAELVYVGETIDPDADYSGKIVVFDLRGASVPGAAAASLSDFVYDPNGTLLRGNFGGKAGAIPANFPVSYYLASDQGAVAMIGILKDYDSGTNKFYSDPSARVHTRVPGLLMGKYDGAALVNKIQNAKGGLTATLLLTGEVRQSQSANIVVSLKGQFNENIIVNTHHDAGWSGAVQDGSGIAAVLGLAKYYASIPTNFRKKNLYFVFDGSHYDWNYPMGANQFAAMNPEVIDNAVLAIGIEHIAKKFKAVKGEYIDTGEIEPRVLYTPPNKHMLEMTQQAVVASGLHDVIIPRSGALVMYGETQSYFLNNIPSYSLISGPEYLFLADDTLDKVAKDEFEAVIKTFITIIDYTQYTPSKWIKHIDR